MYTEDNVLNETTILMKKLLMIQCFWLLYLILMVLYLKE